MLSVQRDLRLFLLARVTILLCGAMTIFIVQAEGEDSNPCDLSPDQIQGQAQQETQPEAKREIKEARAAGPAQRTFPAITTHGLTPVGNGQIIYDSNQNICWLANADLAGSAAARADFGIAGINPDGTMNYATALLWVDALNNYKGKGYLGHTHWQLPNNPLDDHTCSQYNYGNFGVSCTGSALGDLYAVGLGLTYPESVHPDFANTVSPFHNLQPDLYWTTDPGAHKGETTFSFNTGLNGSNTTVYNYFYELPMTPGPIGTPPSGLGVQPYTTGSAAGKAVYDEVTGYTWVLNANLAAVDNFGVKGNVTIKAKSGKTNGMTYVVPLINGSGAMMLSASAAWSAGLNDSVYAGSANWELPSLEDLNELYKHLGLSEGATQLEARGHVGPFVNLQPGFYWACERAPQGNSQSPCDLTLFPVADYIYSFNFDEGFEGTDKLDKVFYVMVYYPAQ